MLNHPRTRSTPAGRSRPRRGSRYEEAAGIRGGETRREAQSCRSVAERSRSWLVGVVADGGRFGAGVEAEA